MIATPHLGAATREALWGEGADPAKWAAIEALWSSPAKWASTVNYWNTPAKWAEVQAYWKDPAKWAEPALWPDTFTQRAEFLRMMDPLNSDPAKWAEASDLHAVPDVTKW